MPEINNTHLYIRQAAGNTTSGRLVLYPSPSAPSTTDTLINIVTVTGIAFGSVVVAVFMGMVAGMVCCTMVYKYKMKKLVAERDQQSTRERRLYERRVRSIEAAEPAPKAKKHISFAPQFTTLREADEADHDLNSIVEHARL